MAKQLNQHYQLQRLQRQRVQLHPRHQIRLLSQQSQRQRPQQYLQRQQREHYQPRQKIRQSAIKNAMTSTGSVLEAALIFLVAPKIFAIHNAIIKFLIAIFAAVTQTVLQHRNRLLLQQLHRQRRHRLHRQHCRRQHCPRQQHLLKQNVWTGVMMILLNVITIAKMKEVAKLIVKMI